MLKTTSPLHMSKSQVMTEEASMISISTWSKRNNKFNQEVFLCFRIKPQFMFHLLHD